MNRWLSRHRNVRTFDRFPYRRGWRTLATMQGLDPDRAWNLARWLARDTTPIRAWSTAVEHLVTERDAMAARLLPRRHSCPTCDRLRHPSAAVEQHPYLAWLEATYRWEVESR